MRRRRGVTQHGIDLLREFNILHEQSLRNTSVAELTKIGMLLGDAHLVKILFPDGSSKDATKEYFL